MSHILMSMFGPMARLLRGCKPEPVSAEPAGDENVHLDKILMLFARRPEVDNTWNPVGGRGETFRLMTREMSPDCVMFSTMENVRAGENLQVRFLLKHGSTLTVTGQVNWVMQSGQGTSGQLDLALLTEEDRHCLRTFLRELRQIR